MAAPNGHYFVQNSLNKHARHHESFKNLWETKWKAPCKIGVYPFMFGAIKDFEPIVEQLVQKDMKEPYDWDAYAATFFPKAEELVNRAFKFEEAKDLGKASELYLRASAVYRIARFPIPRSPLQKRAWTLGKTVCLKGLSLRPHVVEELHIPHTHALLHENHHVPAYYQLPDIATAEQGVPLIIILTGLDGYRTELVAWAEGWREIGCACLIVEIPGTGDSPAAACDPQSPDRLWSSLLDWVARQDGIHKGKVLAWGFSTGAYYAIRMAHTHAKDLAGVVALGGGCHHMFDRAWLDEVDHLEYPFDLCGALAHKFGYGNDTETFKAEASTKFSLLNDGTLTRIPGSLDSENADYHKPLRSRTNGLNGAHHASNREIHRLQPDQGAPNGTSLGRANKSTSSRAQHARLLLLNGTLDEIFPIDDYYLLLQHGSGPKEARFIPGRKHMGEPESFGIALRWIYEVLGLGSEAHWDEMIARQLESLIMPVAEP